MVAAGLAPVIGIGTPWWSYLRRLYREPAFTAAADGFALHPYAGTIEDLTKQLELARKIMAANGDRKAPLVEAFCDFCANSGLFNLTGKAKPAWAAFKRAVR